MERGGSSTGPPGPRRSPGAVGAAPGVDLALRSGPAGPRRFAPSGRGRHDEGVRTRPPIALVALLVLAAGCGSGSKTEHESAAGPAVPWTAEQPPQVRQREPVARPCRASDLHVVRKVRFEQWLEGGIAIVALRNTGTHVCRLTGRPAVRLVHKGGPAQVQKRCPPTPTNFPEVAYPTSTLLALRPGEPAAVTVIVGQLVRPGREGQAARPAQLAPPHAAARPRPPRRGLQRGAVPASPRAARRRSASRRSSGPSSGPGSRGPAPLLRRRCPAQPVHARRGGSSASASCSRTSRRRPPGSTGAPRTSSSSRRPARSRSTSLNCAAAHPIAPGKELAFSMRLRVPKKAPLGPNGLFWALDAFGARAPQVHARVLIDR